MRLLLLILLFFNLSSLLQAQTYDTSYSELRRPGQAVRNLGMGNTGVALSADESASVSYTHLTLPTIYSV